MNVSDEIFDVVDQNDVVIGRDTRAEVHRLGLRHRSVHLLVFDSTGRVFLQKRSMSKDENPGQWDTSVAGHVDSGESYDQCVIREAAEELGIHLTHVPQRLFKFEASEDTGMEFCWIYRTVSDGPFELNKDEIDEGGWFEPEKLDAVLAAPGQTYTAAIAKIWSRLRDTAA